MITIINPSKEKPYVRLIELYKIALKEKQRNIEAFVVSSFSNTANEVNSRCVNLKFIDGKDLIFFSNYNSPKASDFEEHPQISGILYWNKLDKQIRIKGSIKRTSKKYNQKYFESRDPKKNALAISSNQSNEIESYQSVLKRYKYSIHNENLDKCPDFWGGYAITPYYFEFWEGHDQRINKREAFVLKDDDWNNFFLQP